MILRFVIAVEIQEPQRLRLWRLKNRIIIDTLRKDDIVGRLQAGNLIQMNVVTIKNLAYATGFDFCEIVGVTRPNFLIEY